jgi:hypothetical protein
MRKASWAVAILVTLGLVVGAPTAAFGVVPLLSLEQTFAEGGVTHFGTSVACSGSTAIVGGEASAVLYTRYHNTWLRYGVLMPVPAEPTPAADGYGSAVDVDGGIAVVGAPANSSGAGAIYVFTRSGTTWYYAQKLTAADAAADDAFGSSVTIDGTTIVVGAPGEDDGGSGAGAAYVFTQSGAGWTQAQKLTAPDAAAGDAFGHSVCIDVSNLVVGAPQHDTAGAGNAGIAYAYQLTGSTFGPAQPLVQFAANTSDDPSAGARFGDSVAVRGNTMLVGATGASGGAFAFVRPTVGEWVPQQELVYPDGSGTEQYGASVALCTDAALVGAPGESGNRGAAVLFKRTGTVWALQRTLVGSAAVGGDLYGYCVDLYCSVAVVGAPGDNAGQGTAYFHTTTEAVPVYRFYNTKTGTHFYTDSAEERDHVWATWSKIFAYEGVAYMTNPGNNNQPLYRFYNKVNGSHFYTASLQEANHVIATWPNIFTFDGPTYSVSLDSAGGTKIPVYRFYNKKNGSHFYTASAEEADIVIARWSNVYQLEGVAFYLGQ